MTPPPAAQLDFSSGAASPARDISGNEILARLPQGEPDALVQYTEEVELSTRHQRRHRVDHNHINSIRTHQRFRDFERLLAGVRL